MSETEITLAKAYLQASGQDPVAALIRSVRDLARLRRALGGPASIEGVSSKSLDRTSQIPAGFGSSLAV